MLSADFFNIFNHENFNNPSLSISSPATFGVITSTYTPPNRTNSARWIDWACGWNSRIASCGGGNAALLAPGTAGRGSIFCFAGGAPPGRVGYSSGREGGVLVWLLLRAVLTVLPRWVRG